MSLLQVDTKNVSRKRDLTRLAVNIEEKKYVLISRCEENRDKIVACSILPDDWGPSIMILCTASEWSKYGH